MLLLGLTGFIGMGCDWTSGGGVDSWNERWNAINFSGQYFGDFEGGLLVADVSDPGETGSVGSGVTGPAVISFTVHQEGERIEIIDNNGGRYTGNMGSLRRTDGQSIGEGETGHIIGQFGVSGVSAAGMEVEITGSFEGLRVDNTLTDRIINGTWIESGGRTGTLFGSATGAVVIDFQDFIDFFLDDDDDDDDDD